MEYMVETAIEVLTGLGVEWEIIVVDDGSSDRTAEITEELTNAYQGVKLVRHTINRGIGSALRTGISSSSMSWIFYTDCDGQFDLSELEMLWSIRDGADVISGFRRRRKDPLMRLIYSFAYNTLTYIFFFGGFKDVDSSFKLFRREIFANISLRSSSSVADLELLLLPLMYGYRIRQLPVSHYPRRAGNVSCESYRKGIFAWVRIAPIMEMFLQLVQLRLRIWRGDV
ncbi:MAG: glycosyltransferase family 2 protein [Candidatus Aegiribacteria sp.]|nr:glycosyltransferase family 2 protein [Candidatus Aegiribacteria sp.]